MKTPAKLWKELEAEGIKRCCAVYRDGHQCRRRVADQSAPYPDDRGSFCAKHAPVMAKATAQALKALAT